MGKKTVFITPTGIITCVLLHLCLGSGVRLLFHTVYEGFFCLFFSCEKEKKSCAEVSFFCFACFRNIDNCFGYF